MLLQIILAFIWVEAEGMTDITLLNCPSQFNFTKANETTAGARQAAQFFYSAFRTTENIDKVERIVLTGNTDDLATYMNDLMVPYIIVAVIIFIIFLLIVFYCLFDKNWPPCEGLRRDPLAEPYTKCEKRCMLGWLLFFSCGVLVAGFISFSAIPSMKNYIDYTKCSMYSSLDNALNGDTDNGWGGFQQLKYKIGNISSLLDSATTQISTYFTNDDWLVDDMTIMKKKNIEIYTQNEDATYITPNPTKTQTNINAGFDFPRIDSIFIKTGMGPNGTFSTMIDDIDRGLATTEIKSYQAYKIYQSALTLVESSSTIQTNAVSAQNTLSMYIRQFEVLETEMDTFSQDYFDDYFSYGLYLQQAVIGFVLTGSILMLVGGLSTHAFDIWKCRYIVHCGWCFFGIMYTGILVLTFVTLSLGSVSFNFCEYFNSMLTNSSDYSRIGDEYSQNIFNRLNVCLFSDGDALTKFDISDEMKTVTELFTNIATYYDYDNPSSKNYVDLAISTGKLSGWISAIEKYRLGVYVDSNPAETTDDNPNYAVNQLNLYSNTGGGVSTCSKDRWVFDSENCTDSNEIIYAATTEESNGMLLTNDTVICISFNEKFTTAKPSSWTQSDFVRRYVQIREDCPDAYDKIVYYGKTIINYRDSRINLFQGIKDDLTTIYDLNSDFNDVMSSFRTRVDQFYGSVATLNDIVTNQIDGLLVTSDCRALGDSIKFTYNSFCLNFMGEIVKVGVCALILLILLFAGMLTGSIFAVRYANVEKLSRITGEHEQISEGTSSQRKLEFDKELAVSERSQSSDEDKRK